MKDRFYPALLHIGAVHHVGLGENHMGPVSLVKVQMHSPAVENFPSNEILSSNETKIVYITRKK